jgi:hypothetical protein
MNLLIILFFYPLPHNQLHNIWKCKICIIILSTENCM